MSIFKLGFLFLALSTTEAQRGNNGGGNNGGGNNGGGNNGGGNNGGGNNRPDLNDPFHPINPAPPLSRCREVGVETFMGIASFVDTDGSGLFIPTTGDISIAVSLQPQNPPPGPEVTIKAVCILTAEDPSASAPFCTFESELKLDDFGGIEGKTIAVGTPPTLAITGGTGGFFGAYGQINTSADFNFDSVGPGLIQLSFSASFSYCVPATGRSL